MVYVGDNSGARRAKQIGCLGSFKKTTVNIGDFVILAIQHRKLKRRFVTKNIYLAIIVTVKKNIRRKSGFYLKFANTKAVLLSEQGKVVGTRLYGPIAEEMKNSKIIRIINLAKAIL